MTEEQEVISSRNFFIGEAVAMFRLMLDPTKITCAGFSIKHDVYRLVGKINPYTDQFSISLCHFKYGPIQRNFIHIDSSDTEIAQCISEMLRHVHLNLITYNEDQICSNN